MCAAAFPKNREKQRRKRRGKRRRRRKGREEEKLDAFGRGVEQERCWCLDINPTLPYPEPRGGGGPLPPELHHASAPDQRQRRCRAPCTAPTRHGRASSLRRPCPPRARMVSTTLASPFLPCAVRRERDAADEPTVGSRRRTRPFVSYRDLAVALVPPLQPGAAAERLRWCPADATAALRPR